jgi:2-polyprenyl-3-methyl-5-hydroxy-6-metoxy-1,4-benzoquinol methylase
MKTPETRQVMEQLSNSVWAFSALSYALETGLLEQLTEPRTSAFLSERTGIPQNLAEQICDVLVSLNLVTRQGDGFAADEGLLPLLSQSARGFVLANLRTARFQSNHFVDTAKQPASSIGWSFTDPAILQAQGMVSASGQEAFGVLMAKMEGLGPRLQSPSAKALDVGVGVGALSIGMCRVFPQLHAIGFDTQDAPLELARRNVANAGLSERIDLRQQSIEDLSDEKAFDFAFLPQSFMPDPVVKTGLTNIWRSLRPGGWVAVATVCLPGSELRYSVSRLWDTLCGGAARSPDQVSSVLSEAGFSQVCRFELSAIWRIIAGRRPV